MDFGQARPRVFQAAFEAQLSDGLGVAGALAEIFHVLNVARPQRGVARLFRAEALGVPAAREHRVAGEERADVRMTDVFAVEVAFGHDVQQGFQRRAGGVDAAVVEIIFRHALVRRHKSR